MTRRAFVLSRWLTVTAAASRSAGTGRDEKGLTTGDSELASKSDGDLDKTDEMYFNPHRRLGLPFAPLFVRSGVCHGLAVIGPSVA